MVSLWAVARPAKCSDALVEQFFMDWMGNEFQVDDVTIIGIER